jgi:hypothetical protein
MNDVRHVYLHYMIEPLLLARANAVDRMQPILKEVREAPLEFRYRSDTVPLTIECLIKAIEARTMDTGVPEYKIPAGVDRSELPRYEHDMQVYQSKGGCGPCQDGESRHDAGFCADSVLLRAAHPV